MEILFILFVIIYLIGCFINFLIIKKKEIFELGDYKNDLLAILLMAIVWPYIMMVWLGAIIFIVSSWAGTVIYYLNIICDKYIEHRNTCKDEKYKKKI